MEQNIFHDQEFWRWGPVKGWVISADFPCTGILTRMPEVTGYEWAAGTLLMKDGEMIWTQNWLPMLKASTKAFYGVMCDADKRSAVRVEYEKVVSTLRKYAASVYTGGLDSLSDEELLAEYDVWRDRYMDFWAWASAPECATFGGEYELREAVKKKWSGKDESMIMEVLTMPISLSFFQRAELDLLERIRDAGETDTVFADHIDAYYWLDNGYYGSRRRTVEDARTMLSDLQAEYGGVTEAIESIQAYEMSLYRRREELQKKFNVDESVMRLSYAIGDAISWQDERKAEQFVQMDVLVLFLEQIAKRFDQVMDDLLWLRASEIRDLVQDPVAVSAMAEQRRPGCAILGSKDEVEVWSGAEGQRLVSEFWESVYDGDELHGTVASFGEQSESTVSGVARIILDPHQVDDFVQGEVLVAPMTSPDYMPVIRKASAIITDEGGLTAHAAVVSRELGIPCIVGVKSATKLISTGDHVILHVDTGGISISDE